MRTRLLMAGAVTALAGLSLAIRLHARQRGLLYPDGYQYLLMARGIAAHLSPTVRLGPGGELFVPSVDAALKPLFPALVAMLSPLSGPRAAADAITVTAAGATVVLAAWLAARLAGARAAGLIAAVAALASPALAYWSGFTGPDPLAEALVLAAALAASYGRGSLAGAIGALCAATRPEWALALVALAAAGLVGPASRRQAGRALIAGSFVLAALIGLLRPPLAIPRGGPLLLLGALAASILLQLLARWAGQAPRRATALAAIALTALIAAGFAVRPPALVRLAPDEWPLLALAAVGILRACMAGRGRPALMLLAAVVVLAAAYAYRNGASERYLAQLLPLACVAAGCVAAPVSRISARLPLARFAVPATAAGLALAPAITAPPRPRLGADAFAALAGRLAPAGTAPLVSAAPDAYGFLLPGWTQRALRPGVRGLILLDAAQRAYEPGVTAQGVVVARLTSAAGFERPDGRLDRAPALLIRGVAVARYVPPRAASKRATASSAIATASSTRPRSG